MTSDEILKMLDETQAIKHGHFVLTSGRHSDTYVQCARVLESPVTTLKLAHEALDRVPQEVRDQIDMVASPAVGGMLFGFAIAAVLEKNFIFSERKDGVMQFRRSFKVEPGQRVLVAEDVVTTGGSVQEVCQLVEDAGGVVIGVVSLIDRKTDRKFNAPFWPLLELEVQSWAPEACELCKAGSAPESLGSRQLRS